MSRNTVIYAYEQLVIEGYIESKQGSGFYVSVEQPEHFLSLSQPKCVHDAKIEQTVSKPSANIVTPNDINRSFAPESLT